MWRLTEHWMTWTRFYKIWDSIIDRCDRTTNSWYKNYWWRWITYDKKWGKFSCFMSEMHNDYIKHCKKHWEKQTTIDRINVNWNYNKKNCKWATRKEQNRNTRRNLYHKWKCLSQWCEELNLNYKTVFARIKYSWYSFEKALKN